MKKYILTGMVVLVVSTIASENPFDLEESLGELEQDQEMLLAELKKSSGLKELVQEQALHKDKIKELDNDELKIELPREDLSSAELDGIATFSDAILNEPSKKKKIVVKKAVLLLEPEAAAKDKLTNMDQDALTKTVHNKEVELKKEKQATENHEVEAYEKRRAEEMARKVVKRAAPKKEVLAEEEVKGLTQKRTTQAVKVAIKQVNKDPEVQESKIDTIKNKAEVKSDVKVIDVQYEKNESKIAIDKAYEEEVQKMSQEETIVKQVSKDSAVQESKIDIAKNKDEAKSSAKVIDVKSEKEEAKIATDKAYEEAVQEMSQEETISS